MWPGSKKRTAASGIRPTLKSAAGLCTFALALTLAPILPAGHHPVLHAEESAEAAAKKAEKRKAALEGLLNQVQYAASSERKFAMRKIERLEEDERGPFIEVLRKFAREDLDDTIRGTAIDTLAGLKDEGSAQTFIEALKDDNDRVVLSAVNALNKVRTETAVPHLTELVKKADFTENDPALSSAIRLLGNMEHGAVADFLKDKAEDTATSSEVRLEILLYFGRAKTANMNDYLLEIVRDESAQVISRAYATNSVGKIGNPASAQTLREELDNIRALANKNERARYSAFKMQLLTALVRLGDDSVKKELMAAARDDDPRMRIRAIVELGEARMEEARGLLEYIAKNDASRSARSAAETALKKLDGNEDDSDEAESDDGETAEGGEAP